MEVGHGPLFLCNGGTVCDIWPVAFAAGLDAFDTRRVVGGTGAHEGRSEEKMRNKKVEALIEALEPVAFEHGFEVVDAAIFGSAKSPILRIYIDKEGGIDLDDISSAQQEWLEPIVDEVDVIKGAYVLEVSSPGVDRPLRTLEHFERYAGEQVKITCDEPIDGRRRFSGELLGVERGSVVVIGKDSRFDIPFDSISKANVVGRVDFSEKGED